jgi:hypothetical protein
VNPDSIDAFAREWPRQQERWRRLAAWERQQLREMTPDFAAALAWMSEAWELALRHDPTWSLSASGREQWRHHAEIRRRLAQARLAP